MKTDNSDSQVFVQEKFRPISEARDTLMQNVFTLVENSFSGGATPEVDLLIRACWILSADQQQEKITTALTTAVRRQFQECVIDATPENLTLQLKKLAQRIEGLPEQFEAVRPALPGDIKGFDLLSTVANHEIVEILSNLRKRLDPTAFLAASLITAMKDIQCTLRALLGLETSDEFEDLLCELQSEFGSIMQNDYDQITNRILQYDRDSMTKKKGRYIVTPAPTDFMKGLEDAEAFVRSTGLNAFTEIRGKLINTLVIKLDQLATDLSMYSSQDYIVACINNTLDGNSAVSQTAKDHPDLIRPEDERALKQAWGRLQRAGMQAMADHVWFEVMAEKPDSELTADIYTFCEAVKGILESIRQSMFESLYFKMAGILFRLLTAKFIRAWHHIPESVSADAFPGRLREDVGMFVGLIQEIQYPLAENHVAIVEAFRDFMVDSLEGTYYLGYVIIAQEFTDFTPEIAWSFFKARPGKPSPTEEIKKMVAEQYNDPRLIKNPDDRYFVDLTPQKKIPFGKGKKKG